MTITYEDILLLQMQQQAMLFDLSTMQGRQWSTSRITDFFINIQHSLPVKNIVEVGAHEASFSLAIKKKFPQFNVFAFEANPFVYEKYSQSKDIINADINYSHLAINNVDSTIQFNISNTIQGKQEAKDSKRHSILTRKNDNNTTQVSVESKSLDTLFLTQINNKEGFSLWIDAEGATSLILEGAKNLLPHTYSVFVEVESQTKFENQWDEQQLCAFFLQNGFLPIARDFAFRHQYNMIFLRKEFINTIEYLYQSFLANTMSAKIRFMAKQNQISLIKNRYLNCPLVESLLPISLPTKIQNAKELEGILSQLPELRQEKELKSIENTVIVCHDKELEFTINWYKEKFDKVPPLFVVDLSYNTNSELQIYDFNQLDKSMNIHVFFKQGTGPSLTYFAKLAMYLHYKGVSKYSIEKYSLEKMYSNGVQEDFSDETYNTIINFYNALADTNSKYSYLAACKARKEGKPGYIPIANFEQYLHPLCPLEQTDVMCEGGIDDGYTTSLFSEIQDKGFIYAFEPVEENYNKSKQRLQQYSNVNLIQNALWSKTGKIGLNLDVASLSGAFASESENEHTCQAVTIDDFFRNKKIDSIKLDVEGGEIPVLEGALQTILTQKPKLLISIYHKRNGLDLINIPKLLMPHLEEYTLYVAHHRPWYNETILYAIAK